MIQIKPQGTPTLEKVHILLVEMHQLKKLSIGVAQSCNSMCREAVVEALTLLTSRPTCF